MNKHIKKNLIVALCISLLMSMMLAGKVYGADGDVIGGGSLKPEMGDESRDTESEILGPGGEFPGLPQEFSGLGDFNGDDQVDSDDAIFLLMATLFPKDYILNQNGDLNGDGIMDSDDSIYLLMHTLFPKDYPLGGQSDFPDE